MKSVRLSLKPHPLALAIPEMLRDEYVELVADIKANGLKQPIVIFEGRILDGRHRERACAELGITPKTETFTGTATEAKAFVTSINVQRRHLTLEQKRMIVDAELKRDPTQSDRSVAKKAKVSHQTVGRARAASNGPTDHKADRTEASGRKARGRKPKAAAVTKPSDLAAKRILKDLDGIDQRDLTDPAWFAGQLHFHASRLNPLKMKIAK